MKAKIPRGDVGVRANKCFIPFNFFNNNGNIFAHITTHKLNDLQNSINRKEIVEIKFYPA